MERSGYEHEKHSAGGANKKQSGSTSQGMRKDTQRTSTPSNKVRLSANKKLRELFTFAEETTRRKRAGNHRIRHLSRCFGSNSHYCNYALSSKNSRTLDCHSRRHQFTLVFRQVGRVLKNENGQSTVEYALILAAFLAVLVAGGAAWNFLHEGTLVRHALMSASHHVQMTSLGSIADIFSY